MVEGKAAPAVLLVLVGRIKLHVALQQIVCTAISFSVASVQLLVVHDEMALCLRLPNGDPVRYAPQSWCCL